jgi:predicted lipid-binding transport protein (Tim44 family)
MGMKQRFLLPALIALVGSCSEPAHAQQPPAPPALAAPAATETVRAVQDASQTREQLRQILEMYPDAVGEILRRDPTLMGRADYMAAYPQLQQFVAAHPEIPRNVEYYFEGFGRYASRQPLDPEYEALGVLLGGLAGILAVGAMIGVLTWVIRAIINHRRWIKSSQVQAEVHTKLMDRMSTNEELLAYIQSPAGRRFLEAAPIRPEPESPVSSAPVGAIIWSMMAGIVLATVGAGFRVAAGTIADDVQRAFTVVGIILLALGIGFLIASLMAFMVSSRLGLFPPRPTTDTGSPHA